MRILLTRPAAQADDWAQVLSRAGAEVRHIPAMQITPLSIPAAQFALAEHMDIGIFVSSNAVQAFAQQVAGLSFPEHALWLAVGEKTAANARAQGLAVHCDGAFNSESLLALPQLQAVNGRRVLIFRGQGGREYLAEQLRLRGAIVNYYEMYTRSCPDDNAPAFQQCLRHWQPHVISAGSVETLQNSLLLAADCLSERPIEAPAFLLPGTRVTDFAKSIGVKHCIQSRSMRLSDVLSVLKDWWN